MGLEDRTGGHRFLQLAGLEVVSVGRAGPQLALPPSARDDEEPLVELGAPGPDEAVDDEDVFPLVPEMADVFLGLAPKQLAGVGVQRCQAVGAGVQDDAVADDHRADPEVPFRADPAGGKVGLIEREGGSPLFGAGAEVEAGDLGPIQEGHHAAVGGGVQRRIELLGGDAAVHLLPADVVDRAAAVDVVRDPKLPARRRVDGHHLDPVAGEDGEDQRAIEVQNLVGPLGALVRLEDLAGFRIELGNGGLVPQRHVDLLAGGHQPLLDVQRDIAGPGAEPGVLPLAPAPLRNRHLPEQDPVEGVAGDEGPLVGQGVLPGQADRRFVDDRKQPAAGGDQRAHAGVGLVRPQPDGVGDPLVVSRRPDDAVPGDRVAVRPVQVMGPLVDRVGPRFPKADPPAAALDDRDLLDPQRPKPGREGFRPGARLVGRGRGAEQPATQRGQHPEHLLRRQPGLRQGRIGVDDHDVDEVFGIGEPSALERAGRDGPVHAPGADHAADSVASGRLGGQAVDHEAALLGKGQGQLGVGRADHRADPAGRTA